MQSGADRVVLDLDLRTELRHEPIQRDALGGAHIRGGHHPQRHTLSTQVAELTVQQA